jgi:hypothetical protein
VNPLLVLVVAVGVAGAADDTPKKATANGALRMALMLTNTCLVQHLVEVHNRFHPDKPAAGLSDIAELLGGAKAKGCGGDATKMEISEADRTLAEQVYQRSSRSELSPGDRVIAERIFRQFVRQLDLDLNTKLPK